MTEHSSTVKWLVGAVIGLLAAGGGIVALLDYARKPAPPQHRMSALEDSTDRYGGVDYSNFTTAGPQACSDSCLADSRCMAFSFNVSANQCWLKGDVPLRVENSGFVSGVKILTPN